ncbi:MAG TPA: hypothetical protein VH299_00150 [Solirubrobacterales bacterium]|nr:hypothetical protein [Solirubrobacterales bacterium]
MLADALRRLVEARVALEGASSPTKEGDKVEMYTRPLDVEALLAEAVRA